MGAIMKKMYLPPLLLAALLAVVLSACGRQRVQTPADEVRGTLTISGAFALYPLMQRWAIEYQKLHPGVQFDISAGGAGKGMTDVLSGVVDIGMVSRAITTEEENQGAYGVPVVMDAVFPTASDKNPVLQDLLARGVTRETFIGIFLTGEIRTWGQVVGRPEMTAEIHAYTRADACGAAEVWAKYLGGQQEDLLGVGISGDPGLLDAVVRDPLAIGYNNLGYAFDANTGRPVTGAIIVPIDVNTNGVAEEWEVLETRSEAQEAIASGKYPSPPARPLYLVTYGKPNGLARDFLEWILTDGQQFVREAGYVPLSAEQLNEALNRVR